MLHSTDTHRRQWLSLLMLGVAVFFLAPQIVGLEKLLRALRAADPLFLALALGAEGMRYLASAGSTRALARLFDRRVPFLPMMQAFFVSAAANRLCSTGGAPGMLVRLLFLTRRGVPAGGVATIFLIEDIAGLGIGALVLLVGVATLVPARLHRAAVPLALALSLGSLLLALGSILLLRQRASITHATHWLARGIDALAAKWLRRSILPPTRVQRFLDDFYTGATAARRAPGWVTAAFFYNLVRHAAGLAALYFAFLAFDQSIAPTVLILIYTSASFISTTSALPGEVAILGGGFALLFLSLGIAPEIALLALLVSRAVSFWLPLPIGYLAFVSLREQQYL